MATAEASGRKKRNRGSMYALEMGHAYDKCGTKMYEVYRYPDLSWFVPIVHVWVHFVGCLWMGNGHN